MDIGNLKKHADLTFKVVQAKKNALERLNSRQLMAYNGRLFSADANTINIVSTLKQHMHKFYVCEEIACTCFFCVMVVFQRCK